MKSHYLTLSRWYRTLILGLGFIFYASSALAQGPSLPPEVAENYSLAAECYKNEQYDCARTYLRWLLDNAPTVYNAERIHERGWKTYENLAIGTEEPGLKAAYLDSAAIILRTTVTTLQDDSVQVDPFKWYLNYGNFLYRHQSEMIGTYPTPADLYLQAYQEAPERLDPYYVRAIIHALMHLEDKKVVLNFIDHSESHYSERADLVEYFDQIRDRLLTSPEDRIAFLKSRLDKNPDDLESVQALMKLYRALDMSAELEATALKLLEMQPTAHTFRLLANLKYENGEYEAAIEMNAQALKLAEDDAELKRDLHFNIALAHYMLGRLPQARQAARLALRQDPGFGQAYVLIGDLYAKAVANSGSFERIDRAVYWLVLDQYERARSMDLSQASLVNTKIAQYTKLMPDQQDKFFKGWKPGNAYKIDYGVYQWINELTTVR